MNSSISIRNFNINFKALEKPSDIQRVYGHGLQNDVFQKSEVKFFEKPDNMDDDIYAHMQNELSFSSFMDGMHMFITKSPMRRHVDFSLSELYKDIKNKPKNSSEIQGADYIFGVLKEYGIVTFSQLENFVSSYRKDKNTKEVFKFQEIEALKIYSQLDNKADMRNFPDLLLDFYYINEELSENSRIDVNEVMEFLRVIGVNNSDEFDEKFSYLKPEFNDFKEVIDIIKLIDFLSKNYDDKMDMLEEKILACPNLNSKAPEEVYSQINDIIDYFYAINNNESLYGIDDILEIALERDKIKKAPLSKIAPYFNNFNEISDKVQFYKLLKHSDVSISEFNNFTGSIIISDSNLLQNIENKKYLTSKIAQMDGQNTASAKKFYADFKDIVNALCQNTSEINDNLKLLLDVVQKNKISNSVSMLSFYQKMTGCKAKVLTKQEFRDFIELFNYPVDNLVQTAKNKNTIPIKLLEQEKARFEGVKDEIEAGKKAGSLLFANQSALEIYKNYRKTILESTDVKKTVEEIAVFGVESSEEYQRKMKNISRFSEYFNDNESLLKFLETNSIKFDESKLEEKFIQNCLEIFDFISNSDDENKEQKMKYFAQSGFLINSEAKLEELLKNTQDKDKRNEVFSTIVNKKIPSVNELEKFINQFKLPNSNGEKVFEYIKNLPKNCDFKEAARVLDFLYRQIESAFLPITINENNINLINPKLYADKTANQTNIQMFNAIYKPKKGYNFLRSISNAKQTYKEKFTSYDIAVELAKNIQKSDESYKTLSKFLKLDKASLGLDEKCSQHIYVKAIEHILPKQLINFINSNELFDYVAYNGTVPEVSLHARLRLMDRFILPELNYIQNLDTDDAKEKAKQLYKTIFKSQPNEIYGIPDSKRIVVSFKDDSQMFRAVFSASGEMLTINPPRSINKM